MRIRSIWPGFWNSLTIAKLDFLARLYFIGLWNFADDEGRGICDYRLHKAALFPLDDLVTAEGLREIADRLEVLDLIVRYTVGDVRYYSVRSWDEYQHPNRPKDSKLPPPPGGRSATAVNAHPTDSRLGSREGKGREGSRKGEEEQQKPRARALGDAPARAVTRLTRRSA